MQQVTSAFSQYYNNRTANIAANNANKRTFISNTISAYTNRQLICRVRIRHYYAHTIIDFVPILSSIQKAIPISLVMANKGYDDKEKPPVCKGIPISRYVNIC